MKNKLLAILKLIEQKAQLDKLLHDKVGALIFFLTSMPLLAFGVNIYVANVIAFLITTFFALFKEYVIDAKWKNSKADIYDAIYTVFGGVRVCIIELLTYLILIF